MEDKIIQSGTFSGNPISMAAGWATIAELEKGEVIPYINELGHYMRTNIRKMAKQLNKKISVTGLGSLFQIHFTDKTIRNKRDALDEDKSMANEFALRLLNNGVYLPAAHPALLSSSHSKQDLDLVLEIIRNVMTQIR